MSSPIATKKEKGFIKQAVVDTHQAITHSHRIELLAEILSDQINSAYPAKETIRCLDVGCGDMTLAETIGKKLPRTQWCCVDIYPLPEALENTEKWQKYTPFDGVNLPFENNYFDIVVFSDVLHHVEGDLEALLFEAARVSNHILVKDHFEYGVYSRTMLKLMDFVGNWGYGVSVPDRYFTQSSFYDLVDCVGLQVERLNVGYKLYSHLPLGNHILSEKWQFVAMLSQKFIS